VFGLFEGRKLIGITGVFTDRGDSSGATAIFAMSFIEPEYRRRGLSRLLYEARLDWVRAQPQFERVVVTHRESNEASGHANQAFGFNRVGRESRTWPDGAVEDDIIYELRIVR
jgi:RimJ/RimL family protein N-acetyltransferase